MDYYYYYYLKDVILGLKKEYDNYSYILNDLKDSISINDKLLVNNINLYVYENWSMKNPELICDIYRNKKIFDKLYSKLIESDSYDRINLYKNSIYKHGKLKIYFNSSDIKCHTKRKNQHTKNIKKKKRIKPAEIS